MNEPIIQVAGVMDQAEADMLMECGVRYLGFPLRLTVNKEDLSEEDAARIIRALPRGYHGVLITYLLHAVEIRDFCRELGCSFVQLHGPVTWDELKKLRDMAPGLRVFKSLVVRPGRTNELTRMAVDYAPLVDAFITDTFDPATGAEGATGKTHDWSISRSLVRISPKPIILAGGLRVENVAESIRAVHPAGVDAHTGVEGPDGRKDPEKVRRFVEEARRAFAEQGGILG